MLPQRAVELGLSLPGRVVRRDGDVTVSQIDVPESARSSSPAVPATEWRVSVSGRFPPRALRYEVLANAQPIAYGTPAADERSLRSVSTDSAVLTAHITTRYGDGSPPPVASERAGPSSIQRPPHLPNPGGFGPDPVRKVRYDFGDQVYQPPGLNGKVELTADVHYPRGLPDGPYPLVLFMHGNHSTCYKGRKSSYEWPCRDGSQPIPNYEGYDYIAQRLASYGFIVVSVSANGVNVLGNDVRDTGMRQRGELLEKHIELWKTWDTIGGAPFEGRFVGKVDLSRIGTMGHSRGGEGVVWNTIVDRERTHPFGIDAVLALAPVDFDRRTINDVPFAVVLPYCDGDVYDLQGVHYFDDSRYLVPGDPTPKDTVTVMGANHNFFNTVWSPSGGFPGAFDDGTNCPGRLSEAQQRHVGVAYIVGFFRRYLGGDRALDPMWTGAQTPSQIAPAQTLVSYLPPDTPQRRLDVDRFTQPGSLSRDALGAPVRPSDVSHYGWCLDVESDPCVPGEAAHADVHLPGLAQGVIGWSSSATGSVRFSLPPRDQDVSRFDAVQFRGALNPGYQANQGVRIQDLEVVLTDAAGHRKAVPASSVDDRALIYPPLRSQGHFMLNQVRFPLSRFSGVRLKDVTSVELRFNRTPRGVIDLSDLAFVRGVGH